MAAENAYMELVTYLRGKCKVESYIPNMERWTADHIKKLIALFLNRRGYLPATDESSDDPFPVLLTFFRGKGILKTMLWTMPWIQPTSNKTS